MNNQWDFETKAVQAGYEPKNGEPRVAPLCQSTTFRYDTAKNIADLFDLKAAGFFYTRLANPTVDVLEKKIAALEGGVAAVATSSGQAANALSIMNLCQKGGHVISCATLYGGTFTLFDSKLRQMGIDVTFISPEATPDEIAKEIRPDTCAIFGEVLANPALEVLDIKKFAMVAHNHNLPLIVDNTFPTPYLCRPFEFGADFVTHSTTKYLDGHAACVGGIIVEKADFRYDAKRFPGFTEPDPTYHGLVYTRDFADSPYSVKLRVQWIRDLGVGMAPFNAYLTNIGTETLHLRMERHSANALALAQFLQNHPNVAWVNYPFLEGSKYYDRAREYLKGGSGVLCFGVKGGKKEGEIVMNHLKLAAIVVHVADVRTCVLHPASMTHRQLSEEDQRAAGVSPDLIRVSVGIENIEDIKADFDQALNAIN